MKNIFKKRDSLKSSGAVGIVVAVLLVMNVLLVGQNLSMRRSLNARAATLDPAAKSLQVGDTVSELTGFDLDGHPYLVKSDGRSRLFFYFAPSCPYCAQQAPLWREALNNLNSNHVQVVGVIGRPECGANSCRRAGLL